MKKLVAVGICVAIGIAIYTVVMLRLNKTNFIDSPDAMCERIQGGVSLLCRGMVMAGVVEKTKIIARLPYSDWLYLVSTDGKRFER